MNRELCRHCRREYMWQPAHDGAREPSSCGRLCSARADWGQPEWEGAARMAIARRRAGLELTDLDLEALRRHPVPGPVGYLLPGGSGPWVPVDNIEGPTAQEALG